MQTHTDTAARPRRDPWDEEPTSADKRTAERLGGRGVDDELPPEAIAAHARWKAALAAGEPEAVSAYGRLDYGDLDEIEPASLADRIDMRMGYDERETVVAIFGELHADCVHDVMRDEFCRRMEEAPYAQERLRGRLEAGCVTASDRQAVLQDALERVTDADLQALRPFAGDESEARELRRQVVRARQAYVCHDTGLHIAKGDRHLVLTEVVDGELMTTRHSVAAAWIDLVYGDDSLCDALRPEEAPLA